MFENRHTEEILNRYLFNQTSTPNNLIDGGLIRQPNVKGDLMKIDAVWYMTQGPGRFAFASLSLLVQAFFKKDDDGNYVNELAFSETGYSRDDLVQSNGTGAIKDLTTSRASFQQFDYDDGITMTLY